ncbi:DinB family protein [Geothrix sp. PMB-07]|uniref:DinB family protein n=1 Tax=Geothrix sp. PMB-07 TaxID=3068640 RepID=UPI002740CF84|nr:DinB family protein [Geothrix sp. PMB-07]WLT33090.1 DinB family protein [Geothrix sp. PMB-07]
MSGALKDLLAHQAWADAKFFSAWQRSGLLQDEELRIRADHQVTVLEAFLHLLKGGEVALPERPIAGFHELQARCGAAHQVYLALGHSLDSTTLERTLRVPWFPEPPCVLSVADLLLQVCMHSQHHRGQNMARLRALGGQVINVDYIIWLWKQKPEARWS